MVSAIQAANKAAKAAFDSHLTARRATATMSVPQAVVDAAEAAYRDAGGAGEIEVRGYGNTTHPVCGVEVKRAKARR